MKDWDDNATAPPLADLPRGLRTWIGCDLSKLIDTTVVELLVEWESRL